MATKKKAPRGLSELEFWKILGKLNWKKSGDDAAVLAPAIKALSLKSEREIEKFEDLLAEKLYAIDTREHCRAAYAGEHDPDDGDDYISADDFLYGRCVELVNGQKHYASVLKNPSKMHKGLEFEAVLSLARRAFELKTGREFDHSTPRSYESFSNKAGWAATSKTRKGQATGKNVPLWNRRPS